MSDYTLAVVGGGVAGLAGAREARLAAARAGISLRVVLYEAEPRLGGKIQTEHVDGVPLEWGPDSFVAAKPWARDLALELGLGPDLVGLGPEAGRAYLWLRGRLRALPRDLVLGVPRGVLAPLALARAVASGIVGPAAALRALAEPFIRAEPDPDGPVREVARRRLGRRVADRLVAPLVEAVFGAPASELSMQAAFPELSLHRSLTLAMARRPRVRGSPFLTVRGGMDRLAEALAGDVPGEHVRTGCSVRSIEPRRGGFEVVAPDGRERADAVLLSVPAPAAASLIAPVSSPAAEALAGIRYRPSAVLLLRFPDGVLDVSLRGSGFLSAPEEGRTVAACSFLGVKWPHLGTRSWVRAVVTSTRALSLPDHVLHERVAGEVRNALRVRTGPIEVRMHRWAQALPVYAPGHASRVEAADRALPPLIALGGASYQGIGLPDCIRSGREAGRRLVAALPGARPSAS